MSLPLSRACIWYCQEADLPLTTRAIQRLHPSNFLLLGSSSAFLCLNLMYYLISLSAQNCLPAGYLLSLLSGKEFGVVGLAPDSASGKLRPNGPSIFLSPGSGRSALRLCSAGLQTWQRLQRWQCGPTKVSPAPLMVPVWAALIPKSLPVQPTELCVPSIWSSPVEGVTQAS